VAGGELEPGEYVELSVTDSGEGMPPQVLDHLFEPFFTTKELGKGTGLGLSMVYGIVKQSGGAIAVESAQGHGTTFRVYLPAATGAVEAAQAAPVRALPGVGGERVLVVEDNPAVRNFVTEALRSAGYQVFDAESAEVALDLLSLSEESVDLLLTDVVLPRMDGYELARVARAVRPSLSVLYMSGYADSPRLRDAALRSGIDLIEKPFTSGAVSARVRAILDRTAVK
jgi:CheY-like chemotaxis protein